MKILVACEESQAVTIELRKLGHEAFSCDIEPCSGGHPEWHLQQDVLPLLNGDCTFQTQDIVDNMESIYPNHMIKGKWDMIIAFPPCTHLAVSGATHFEKKRADGRQREGIEFFMQFMNADCDKIAVENPVNIISGNYISKYFIDLQQKYCFPIKPTQIIQPYFFGDAFEKKTCLWVKGLPVITSTNIVEPPPRQKMTTSNRTMAEYFSKGGKERQKNRSKTFPGIAKAMATQWAGRA